MKERSLKRRKPMSYSRIGDLLREARIRTQLTQRRVAALVGYSSAQHVCNFESGSCIPPVEKLRHLVRVLNIDAVCFVEVVMEVEKEILLRKISEIPKKVRLPKSRGPKRSLTADT